MISRDFLMIKRLCLEPWGAGLSPFPNLGLLFEGTPQIATIHIQPSGNLPRLPLANPPQHQCASRATLNGYTKTTMSRHLHACYSTTGTRACSHVSMCRECARGPGYISVTDTLCKFNHDRLHTCVRDIGWYRYRRALANRTLRSSATVSVSILLLAHIFCTRPTTTSMRVRANVRVRACYCNPRLLPIKCILYDIASDHNDDMPRAASHSRIPHATTLHTNEGDRTADAVTHGRTRALV